VVTVFSEWYFLTVNRPRFSPAPFHRELHEHDRPSREPAGHGYDTHGPCRKLAFHEGDR
jgi:hypothetical protein